MVNNPFSDEIKTDIYQEKRYWMCRASLYAIYWTKVSNYRESRGDKKNSLAFHVFIGKNLDFSLLKQQPIEKWSWLNNSFSTWSVKAHGLNLEKWMPPPLKLHLGCMCVCKRERQGKDSRCIAFKNFSRSLQWKKALSSQVLAWEDCFLTNIQLLAMRWYWCIWYHNFYLSFRQLTSQDTYGTFLHIYYINVPVLMREVNVPWGKVLMSHIQAPRALNFWVGLSRR